MITDTTIESPKSTTDPQLWLKHPQGLIPRGTCCQSCGRYNSRNMTCHAIVWRDNKVVLVLRNHEPKRGWWALPAGYLDWDESLEDGALRELYEETGIIGQKPRLVDLYSDPRRDPDGRQNVAVTYLIEYKEKRDLTTPEEVSQIAWYSLDELPQNVAFDHRIMIQDSLKLLA